MKTKEKLAFKPDYAVSPGETLQEVMESLGMTLEELSRRTGLTKQSLIRIFRGDQPISFETADRLELVTNIPARFWNNLEALYREQLAKIAALKALKSNAEWLQTIPVSELTERGLVQKDSDTVETVRSVLSFYGVASVDAWNNIWESPAVAARRSQCFETDPGSASAWIRQGELKTHKIECRPFDKKIFECNLLKIRSLTTKSPDYYIPEIKKLCAEAGVAFVMVKEMKKVPWNGAFKWLTPEKAMILLSLRGRTEDKFWFSFFHEAGHVLHDSKKDLIINDGNKNDLREIKADKFASDFLIPSKYEKDIKLFKSSEEIIKFASELGISAGIVAGRYQFLTKKWTVFRDLIKILEWSTNDL